MKILHVWLAVTGLALGGQAILKTPLPLITPAQNPWIMPMPVELWRAWEIVKLADPEAAAIAKFRVEPLPVKYWLYPGLRGYLDWDRHTISIIDSRAFDPSFRLLAITLRHELAHVRQLIDHPDWNEYTFDSVREEAEAEARQVAEDWARGRNLR